MAKSREAQFIEIRWSEYDADDDTWKKQFVRFEMTPAAEPTARVEAMRLALEPKRQIKDIRVVEIDQMVETIGVYSRRDVIQGLTPGRPGG